MQEIKCPNCGEIFAVDESGYAQIVRQVRDKEFEKEIRRRETDLTERKDSELKLARMEQKQEFDRTLSAKDAQLFEVPAAVLLGKELPAGLLQTFFLQIFWIGVFLFVHWRLFRRIRYNMNIAGG